MRPKFSDCKWTDDMTARPRISVRAAPKDAGVRFGLMSFSYQGPPVVIHPPIPGTSTVVIAATTMGSVTCPYQLKRNPSAEGLFNPRHRCLYCADEPLPSLL